MTDPEDQIFEDILPKTEPKDELPQEIPLGEPADLGQDSLNLEGMPDHASEERHIDERGIKKMMPIDPRVAKEALSILDSGPLRLNATATAILDDPILTLEILKIANAQQNPNDFFGISNIRRALGILGNDRTIILIMDLLQKNTPLSAEANYYFQELRLQSKICARINSIIAGHTYSRFPEEAEIVGLFSNLGLMSACTKFEDEYPRMATHNNKPSLICKLETKLSFNAPLAARRMLLKSKIPQILLGCIDPKLESQSRIEAQLRMITNCGKELTSAIERKKFSRYTSKQELPTGSALRILSLPTVTLNQVIEECSAFLTQLGESP